MARSFARSSLSALARLPLAEVLASSARRVLPAQVQRFARDAYRRVLRDFPLVGELLELARVLRQNAVEWGAPERTAGRTAVAAAPAAPAPAVPAPAIEIEPLLARLNGPSAEAAAGAVEQLARSGDPRARAALLAALRNDSGYLHPLPRVQALRALAADCSEAERAAIVAAVGGVSAELSLAAIAALTQYAPAHALPPLRKVIEDRTGYYAPEVRAAAEQALGMLQRQA